MKSRITLLVAVLMVLFGWIGQTVYAQNGYPQQFETYVDDYAHLLTPDAKTAIQSSLTTLKNTTGIDAVVVTIRSIGSYPTGDPTIESFALNLFNTWKIGNAQTNRGVMLLVAVDDRKVRIQLGDGYDISYNNRVQTVIDNQILPAFREDQYTQGIQKGVQGLIQVVSTASSPLDILFSRVNPALLLGGVGVALAFILYGVISRFQHRCPQCGQITLDIQSNVLQYPTYTSSGEREIRRICSNCDYRNTYTVTMSRLYRSTYRSSGGGGSSGSSSGGGGHSSGGGATGSW